MAELLASIPVSNHLGEGVLWDEQTQQLLWTDIEQCTLYRMAFPGHQISKCRTPERLCSFGLSSEAHVLVVAFATGFARYDYESGQVDWLARPPEVAAGLGRRLNDGRVDRQGRFWCGAMVEDSQRAGAGTASLYCLDAGGEVSIHASNIGISNSICWSPSGQRMYFADSPERTIYTYDFDANVGAISARKVFVRTPPEAYPDGAITDADGYLWSAHWGAGQVVRYTPWGVADQVIELATCQPSCVALGGPDRSLLFVTTARQGLNDAALARQPQTGNLFIYQLANYGLTEPRYHGFAGNTK